jgi:hypothetical protein
MKTNPTSVLLLFTLVLGACTYAKYLPKPDAIDISQYGSYIEIKQSEGKKVKGELLAVDSNALTVLSDTNSAKRVIVVPLNQAKKFSLLYAVPKNYSWAIPIFSLITATHGYFLIFSLPVNLITTISVTMGAIKSFSYNNKKITYEQLKMFARYPQGIPEGVDISSIK